MNPNHNMPHCRDCGVRLKSYKSVRCVPCAREYRKAQTIKGIPDRNPSGLCMCGCGKPVGRYANTVRSYGYVKGRYKMYLPNHHSAKSPVEYIEDPETGCWIWQRGFNYHGYGMAWTEDGRKTTAIRVIYERFKGDIPEGLFLDHLCRNPPCVNPDHLEPVTHRENVYRGKATKLSDEDVVRIRELAPTHSYAALGRMFGVSYQHISRIVRGLCR